DFYWPVPSSLVLSVVGWALWGLAAVLAAGALRRAWSGSRHPTACGAGLLVLVAAFLPVMQLIPLNIIVADRFAYLALIPAAALGCGAIIRYLPSRGALAAIAILVALASWRSVVAAQSWQDSEHLWHSVLSRLNADESAGHRLPNYERAHYSWGRARLMAALDAGTARGSSVYEGAFLAMRRGYLVNPGGAARLCQAAWAAGHHEDCLAAGGEVLDQALSGEDDALVNLSAVEGLMDDAVTALVTLDADAAGRSRAQVAWHALAGDDGRRFDRLLAAGPAFDVHKARWLRMRGRLEAAAGQPTVATATFTWILEVLGVDDPDVRFWRLQLLLETGAKNVAGLRAEVDRLDEATDGEPWDSAIQRLRARLAAHEKGESR
ncbi:MAG: hypothetical protein KDB53_12890, partial [Planctomycetes bacterium]|nr:hypothetical protein [Planctomycetota bacterium]